VPSDHGHGPAARPAARPIGLREVLFQSITDMAPRRDRRVDPGRRGLRGRALPLSVLFA